ncbi:MAG: hypothetical protein Q8P18_22430 [Pseudomonadota bacterium]|nr:hypothetical protein [Pseudomonadota bacterium]
MLTLAMVFVTTAAAEPFVDIGLGYRLTIEGFDDHPEGLRVFGRVGLWDHFAVEVGAFGRFPGNEISGLTHTLVGIAYEGNNDTTFQQPVSREIASFSAFVALSPWARVHDEKKPTMWIHGIVGVDTRLIVQDVASINPDYVAWVADADPAILSGNPETVVVPSPAAGFGIDAWFLDRLGVRVTVIERAAFETGPDSGAVLADWNPEPPEEILVLSGAFSLDLMVTF